jgi:3-oxoacyl-[acyl-carrier protein] reductase
MSEEKYAVVTGGSRGIGRAICEKLAAEGYHVALIYAGNRDAAEQTAEAIRKYGKKALAVQCNVADAENTKEAFQQILAQFGQIDVLVNNAGITKDKLSVMMKPEDFEAVIGVNLTGTFHCIRQAAPAMLKRRSGRIINLSSVSGLMGNAGQANYSASKAGIIGLTKTIAKELASRGITCNAVAPGFVETDMTAVFQGNEDLLKTIPLHRFAKAEEVAALVAFLASEAAGYITGEVIRIDGGLAM